jgi:diguanylate cyclase (GGDEF)-like protein
VARLGGDEFGFVLSSVENREGAQVVVRRLAERCEQPFSFEDTPLKMGASLGLAIYPEDGEQPDALIDNADQSMYVMKRRKKGTARHAATSAPDDDFETPPG